MTGKVTRIVRRRRVLVGATVLLAAVVGAALVVTGSSRSAVVYQAEHLIAINSSAATAAQTPPQAVLAATRRDVPQKAARALHYRGDPLELASGVEFALSSDNQSITVSGSGSSPKAAQRLVDAFAEAFIDFHRTQADATARTAVDQLIDRRKQLQATMAARQAQYPGLATGDQDVPPDVVATDQSDSNTLQQLDQQILTAQTVQAGASPYASLGSRPAAADSSLIDGLPIWIRFAFGVLITLLIGAGVIALLERIFPRLDTAEELAKRIGLPVIAEIPRLSRQEITPPLTMEAFDGATAEAHRGLRTALDFAARDAGLDRPAVIMVVSAGPGEGKTMTSGQLAVALAETGRRVALLSCDFRRPNLHQLFGCARDPGINSGFSHPSDLSTDIIRPDVVPGVTLVASGPPTRRMVHLIPLIRDIAGQAVADGMTVVIDTAPMLAANDVSDLLEFVDQVVVVAMPGRTNSRALRSAVDGLRRNDATLTGAVLVGASDTPFARLGYYYYDEYVDDDDASVTRHPGDKASLTGQ